MTAFIVWRGPEVVALAASFVVGTWIGWRAGRAKLS